jgi:AcrR family transcriptional regulator
MAVDRLRKPDYFEAGLELLASGGIGAVTISALCYRLGVTKGSFYHHFSSQTVFQDEILAYWATERADQLMPLIEAMDPIERLEALKRGAVALRHESESAIRAWARTNTAAAATQARVDHDREMHLAGFLADAGIPRERAALLARIGMSILIATQQLERPVDRKRLMAAFDEYQRWLESVIATERNAPVLSVVGRKKRTP